MLSLLACTAVTLLCALTLGQALLRLCGAPAFTWLSAPVGVVAIMLLAIPSLHMPGRTTTTAVIIGLLTVAALLWLLRSPAHRPPVPGLLAGVPVLLLGLVPFIASGRVGTLGWNFNNDMATHLLLADSHKYQRVVDTGGLDNAYPLGMHAWTAVASTATGAPTDLAFAGVTVALPILLGWTALGAMRRIRWWGPFVVVPLVGLPFLVAGYFGQGSFKELIMALLLVACATVLTWTPDVRPRLRWVPFALLVAGAVSVYSYTGILWPAGFFLIWLGGQAVGYLRRGRFERPGGAPLREALGAMAIGFGLLLVVLIPQYPRIKHFYDAAAGTNGGTGIDKSSLGNLAGPLPFWESLGTWTSADYRVAGPDMLTTGAIAGLVLAFVLFGALWSLRRREWMLPGATAFALLVWAYSNHSQSPYVAAKALMLLTPMLMVLAVRPLVDRGEHEARWPMPSWGGAAAPVLAVALLIALMPSTVDALRYSSVGATDHTRELQSLQGIFTPQDRVLFLGNDDFIRWELQGSQVNAPVIGFPTMPIRPEKPWEFAKNIDFDSVPSEVMNEYGWVVAPRDAAGSMPPPELKLVRQTPNFDVYRRIAPAPPTSVLAEGEAAAVPLDCNTKAGRAVLRGGGVAAVRPASITVAVDGGIAPGGTLDVALPLPAGTWDLVTPYGGPRPIEVTGPGLKTTLPANLDRPGPRWPIGRITTDGRPVTLALHPTEDALTLPSAITTIGSIISTPVGQKKVVPVAQACGKLVDWYRPATK